MSVLVNGMGEVCVTFARVVRDSHARKTTKSIDSTSGASLSLSKPRHHRHTPTVRAHENDTPKRNDFPCDSRPMENVGVRRPRVVSVVEIHPRLFGGVE